MRKANVADYVRFVLSGLLLLFSLTVTSYAIWEKKTMFWDSVPGYAALILFFVDLFFLGIVEGLQIALVELKRQHPDSYKRSHPRAFRLGQLAAKGDNVERFLMGRQVCVVVLVFFAAKLTTIHLDENEGFLFPTPGWVQSIFYETGLLACVVVVIIAQLMPQIVAAKFPVHFLQILIMRPAYYVCWFLELTGLTHICWVLSHLMSLAMGMKDDVTTKNPNEYFDENSISQDASQVLEKIDASLESVTISTITNCSMESEKKVPLSVSEKNLPVLDPLHEQFSQYTALVDELNNSVDPDTMRVLRHYLDSHPEKFYTFPSVIGNKLYPAPHHLAEEIRKQGATVPKFLTDISDPEHVPPHIVACELLAKNKQLKDEMELLKNKLKA